MAKRERKRFTPEFKAEVVLEALSDKSSQAELCRCHNLSEEYLSSMTTRISLTPAHTSGVLSHRDMTRSVFTRH